jgi:hypothetical protein
MSPYPNRKKAITFKEPAATECKERISRKMRVLMRSYAGPKPHGAQTPIQNSVEHAQL